MKTITTILALFATLQLQAQFRHQASARFAHNQITLSYRNYPQKCPLWFEPFIGLSNQDVNNKFDDKTVGIKTGIPLANLSRWDFYGALSCGYYFTSNKLYRANTPYGGFLLGSELKLGKQRKSRIAFELGYTYGEKSYSQTSENDLVWIKTTDRFKLSPIYYSIGYAFCF